LRDAELAGEEGRLTPEEETTPDIYSVDLATATSAMRHQQVECQGHNTAMQEYVFLQIDNSSSYNFVEKTVELFLRLVKNEKAADILEVEEAACVVQAMGLPSRRLGHGA